MQLYDDGRCGLHFQIGKGGGFHLAEAESRGQALPVNVFLGGPPALILAAIAPLPENVPEVLLACSARRAAAVAREPRPLPIVADAEFALVGEVAAAASADPKDPSATTTATTR